MWMEWSGVLSVTFGLGQAERVALLGESRVFLCLTQPHAWNPHALIDAQKHRTVASKDRLPFPSYSMYSYH